MQITETSADGLKREIQVVLGAQELAERRDRRLDELKDTVQIKGFRKGKVPAAHLKKVYGRQLMAEILQDAVDESSKKALDDRNERPAGQPKIDFPEDEKFVETVIEGQADFSYSMTYEIIPKFDVVDFSTLELERLVADVESDEIDKAIQQLAERNVTHEPSETEGAADGFKLKIDFVGTIDGEAFEGGTAEGIELVMGQGGFIPGFEDGLMGAKAGEDRTLNVTFPEDYQVETLKGKAAVFAAKVTEVATPKEPEINDEFAVTLGAENLEKLREMVSEQMVREYEQVSRMKMKRVLLDLLNEKHDFELPPTLVESEFEGIWSQVTQRLEQEGKTFEDEKKNEAEQRVEFRDVAERRVRLGLVLGEIGESNKVEVSQDELRQALFQEAQQYPGQAREVYEFYEKTPGAIAQLRAPIFEDKVIDLIVADAKVVDKKVSVEELAKPLDEDDADEVEAVDAAKDGAA
ncbi:MAG: trigger factor [Alphaproteobacteria bacterium]|jgi:trigger factor